MSATGRTNVMEKPMSVEQIVKLASEPYFSSDFSMRNWFRTADLMLKQANIYEHEGNDQMAYFLLYRHAHLILDDLNQHPHARDSEYRQAWASARRAVKASLAKLEVLKPRINKRYERYEERRKPAAPIRASAPTSSLRDARRPSTDIVSDNLRRMSLDSQGSRPSSRQGNESPARLDAGEHRHMAVDLANREMRRRAQRSQHAPAMDDNQDAQTSLLDVRRQMDMASQHQNYSAPPSAPLSATTSYNYPNVPQKSTAPTPHPPSSNGAYTNFLTSNEHDGPAPIRPPKQYFYPTTQSSAPPIPRKTAFIDRPPTPPTPPSTTATPPPNRQFATTSTLESGAPLRTIFLPSPLRHAFTRLAATNTRQNLETCGILCGTLLHNAFFITRLVIPEQTATSDTCEMINEEALYGYIDAQPEGLMVLGWIHTHPTQTCFLSSRDLHTHVWYQVQLAESIAIVCAPSKTPDYGIFRLTDPPGMQTVRVCKASGIFHPHSETHLYTEALGRPGHVIEHEDLQFEVVDLRQKA